MNSKKGAIRSVLRRMVWPGGSTEGASLTHVESAENAPGHVVGCGNRVLRLGFLLGYGKSGTNWVGSLLNLHPRLLCEGEFHFQYFFEAERRFSEERWLMGKRPEVARATRAALENLVRQGMRAVAPSKPAAEWIVDRSPRPFEVLLAGAPHIYLVRDGRDALVSFTFHQLREARPEGFPPETRAWLSKHLEAFQRNPECVTLESPGLLAEEPWVRYHARRWADQTRQDMEAIAAAEKAGTPSPVLVVRYEDLHAGTEVWRRRMYEHFGLDPAEAAPLSPESKTTPGFAQEDRKGQVGDWKNFRTAEFDHWFKEEAGDALIRQGYEKSLDW